MKKSRTSQLSDDDVLASQEWLKIIGLEEDRTFDDQITYYISTRDGTDIAVITVDVSEDGQTYGLPKLFGNVAYPYGLISDKPTRGLIRTFCEVVGQDCI